MWVVTGLRDGRGCAAPIALTATLIGLAGATFAVPDAGGACCGALHVHAGLATDARRLAEATMGWMPGDAPILVNSAGCGAAMKDLVHLLGTAAAGGVLGPRRRRARVARQSGGRPAAAVIAGSAR